MKISIIIPTYNRLKQLSDVLDCIFLSDVEGLDEVDLVVVDDGSPVSVKCVVEQKIVREPFILRCIRQENAGPAAARNNGFRNSTNEIVLFIDDDILVFPDLILRHFEGHRAHPGSVIFGRCPFEKRYENDPCFRFLNSLEPEIEATDELERVRTVASGNISVERSMFEREGVYRANLRTPAAEEFELENRLNTMNIPMMFDRNAKGWHLQPATIEDKTRQEYKYGVGASEVWIKIPEISANEHIAGFVLGNGPIDRAHDPARVQAKKLVKGILSGPTTRSIFLRAVKLVEMLVPSDRLLFPLYRLLCGLNLFAGVRDGLKKFRENLSDA